MFNNTLSAILRGAWLIEEQFAVSHLPVVMNLINGKLSGQEFLKGSGDSEKPFIFQANGERVNPYVFTDEGLKLNKELLTPNFIAVVPFIGVVTKYDGACGEPGLIKRQGWILDLTSNPNCAGYISLIDSPGGQADGTPQTAAFIKNLNVRTAAVVLGGAYSAGAWIAAPHDNVYAADEFSCFGSIGAYTTIVDYTGYFKKQGVNVQSIYPKSSKDKNLSYRKALAGDTSMIEDEVNELALSFIKSISENRSGKLTSDEWNTGKVFSAAQSIEIGLIDGIKPLMSVVEDLRTSNKQVITIKNSNNMDISKIKALAGTETPSQDVLDAANAELTTEGITGVTLVPESVITAAEQATTENTTLKDQVKSLTTAKEKAEGDLATANTTIEGLNTKIASLPGGAHILKPGADPEIKDESVEDADSIMANLPHNKNADRVLGS